MEHDAIPLGERHQPHNFEYADEAERLAAVVTDAKWLQSLALQLDNGSYWRVTGVSPATWEQVVTAWVDIPGKPTEFPPEAHSHAISEVVDLQDELDAKEPTITKSIGYAKWTGSAWSFSNENYMQTSHDANAVTAAAISNWNTAFGWGNHATAGYQASLGFTPENLANKSTNATADAASNTKYPSVKAIVDYAVSADASVLSSAATDATTKANAAQAAAVAASTPVSHLGSGGTAHANVAAAGAAGFMTGADKTKLDAITGANSGDETGARIATLHHAASAKTTLVDADELTGQDSAAGFGLIRVTWANIKATLATWIGGGTIAGSFTTIAASSTVSGTGFSTYLASPPAIGATTPAAANFTTLGTTGTVTIGGATVWINTNKTLIQHDGSNGYIRAQVGTLFLGANGSSSLALDASGNVLVIGPAGLGYGTGAGGTVTQATSRTTGVTINRPTGAITLVSAAGSTSWQSFTVTNSIVTNGDVPKVVQKSGTDKYRIHVTNVATGSFQITYATTGGTTTEQPVFNFSIDKGSAA